MPFYFLLSGAAYGTDSLKHQVVPANLKAARIFDRLFQVRNIIHLNVKDLATLHASNMVVLMKLIVKMVCASRRFDFANLADLSKML